jgi:hypothetical protein
MVGISHKPATSQAGLVCIWFVSALAGKIFFNFISDLNLLRQPMGEHE